MILSFRLGINFSKGEFRKCKGHHGILFRGLRSLRSSEPFRILFLGRDEFSVLVLDQLYRSPDIWSSIHVATHPDERTGRNRSELSVPPLKLRSDELSLQTCLIPARKSAFKDWKPPDLFNCPSPTPNHLLITASFGRMVPDRILDLFPVSRRLNVHPSLLPLYRGPAPIQHTIADGKEETGVCVLEMKEKRFGADVGEIWDRKSLAVPPKVTYSELRDALAVEGGKLLVSVLREMLARTIDAVPQDDARATRAPFISQETAAIDFQAWDAQKIERMHRAIGHQRPLTTTLPSSRTLQLLSPRPYIDQSPTSELPKPLSSLRSPGDATYDPTTRTLAIRCANGTFICVASVKQQDKKQLPAQEWWKGVRPEWFHDKVMRLGHKDV